MAGNVEYCDGCWEPFCVACESDALSPSQDRQHLYCERCHAKADAEEVA